MLQRGTGRCRVRFSADERFKVIQRVAVRERMPDDHPSNGDDGTDTDLTDFGVDATPDPPRVQKRTRIQTITGDGTAGYTARTPDRNGLVFVASRDSHDHRLRHLEADRGGAYAFSVDALDRLATLDVTRILIHEVDTGDVLEWPANAFYDGDEVPARYLETTMDPQQYATVHGAEFCWDDHGGGLYLPQSAVFDDSGLPADGDGGDDA